MVTVESSTVNTAETLHEIKGSLAELKQEQEEAVVSLLDSRDVLAVLPTGFGIESTRSGVKWVDTQKPWGFLPALLFLSLLQSPPLHFHAPKEFRKQTFSGSI